MNRAACWAVLLLLGAPAANAARPEESSCVTCHSDPKLFTAQQRRLVDLFAQDVHRAAGLSCQDCHGGNPAPTGNPAAAMDKGFAAHPFVGAPARAAIPGFCGRCHSDPVYMKRFKPGARVDQEREYWTSNHGKALRQGDTKVATCVDCHGAHGILPVSSPESPVYRTRIAATCSSCHSDPRRMAGYLRADGRPLPVDQFARWRESVHAQALLGKGDLSAPTCNDCHGNHGATPPGVDSVAFVCGQCHGREADLFGSSPKSEGFRNHNDMLAQAGEKGCATCHQPPDPAARLTTLHAFSGCVTCHGNHGIVRPTVAMLGPLPATPCVFCHEGAEPAAEPVAKRKHYIELRDSLLATARVAGLKGEELYNWMVDRAQSLPTHTQAVGASGAGQIELRPEFGRFFGKFRIGKTYYTYLDPVTGRKVRSPITRCEGCHASAPTLTGTPVGLQTSQEFLARTHELTVLTARAERTLLTARRGGVETGQALPEIDAAVDAQIQLEVLVHTFSVKAGAPFLEKQRDGVRHARLALAAARHGVEELDYRRRGLLLALAFIVLVLIALGLRIRQQPL